MKRTKLYNQSDYNLRDDRDVFSLEYSLSSPWMAKLSICCFYCHQNLKHIDTVIFTERQNVLYKKKSSLSCLSFSD